MQHSDFIKLNLINRGDKTRYAKSVGISLSFLRQIEVGIARTPRSKYEKVLKETGGKVSLEDLISEKVLRKP